MRIPFLACCALSLACSKGSTQTTAVRLTVIFDAALAIDQLEVSVESLSRITPEPAEPLASGYRVLLLVNGGSELRIGVWGLEAGVRVAFGDTAVTPEPGQTVEAKVELSALPCGDYCVPGARECVIDAVRVCETRGDGCAVWGEAVPCKAPAPFCSAGSCSATCVDECSDSGELRCSSSLTVQECGQHDSDDCLDWITTKTCKEPLVCSKGACANECADECATDETDCLSDSMLSCGQFDADDCLEWSPAMPCDPEDVCEATSCADGECFVNVCGGPCVLTSLPDDPCDGDDGDECIEGVFACLDSELVCDDATDTILETCGNGADDDCDGTIDDGCWIIEVVDSLGDNIGNGTSIGMDSTGSVHISYQEPLNPRLRHAQRPSAGAWTTETVPYIAGEGHGEGSSLVVAPDDSLHITCYAESGGFEVRYFRWVIGGAWSSELVADIGGLAPDYETSLALDASGTLHVAFFDLSANLKYGFRPSKGGWTVTDADPADWTGFAGLSLALDSVGSTHTVYPDSSPTTELKHGHFFSGSWSYEILPEFGERPDVAVNGDDAVLTVYEGTTVVLGIDFATNVSGSFVVTPVDDSVAATAPTIAVDTTGGIHVSYSDNSTPGLRYAYSPDGSTWDIAQVTSTNPARDSDILVDADGGIHISFYESSVSSSVSYAYRIPE